MKYFRILAMLLVAATLTFSACDGGGTDSTVTDSTVADGDAILTIAAIPGVMSPVLGETPVTEITETAQYTGTVSWAPADNPFDYETEYTATITLTAKSGYTLTGVEANFFTVAGATTVSNTADTGVITAIFPATLAPPAGANIAYTLPSSISFNMKYVPGGTFPTGTDDLGANQTISTPYWMAETEVTYELWNAVRTWATTTGGYTFANAGVQGDSGAGTNQHPVTTINWRDSMVWCNALTEYYNANNGTGTNLDCVYYTDSGYTTPQRSSADGTYGSSVNATTGSFDEPYVKAAAKGFRLPGSMEWECAARYRGSDTTNSILNTGVYWTKGNSASGATDYAYTTAVNPLDTAGESGPSRTVAWYSINSGSVTKPVAGKTANALGIRDMSGNVWEWCFDWHPSYVGSYRVLRGGSWGDSASGLRVGGVYDLDPYLEFSGVGFRFVSTGALMSIKLFKDNLPVSAQVQIP